MKGNLIGQVAIHVDDFIITGKKNFIDHVIEMIKDKLKISKTERGKFRFTGIDVEQTEEGIQISMEDYANSIQQIPIFRKDSDNSPLTPAEQKIYRKYVGKLLWLSENVRPDLAFLALHMSRKVNNANLKDLKKINTFITKQVSGRENKIMLKHVGNKDDLIICATSDAAFYQTEQSIQGEILMLANKKTNNVSPLFWKSKAITRVCKSSKDAETRAGGKCVEDSVYTANRIEKILYGDNKKRVKVDIHTDSEPLVESIKSTKRVENKALCNEVEAMKEAILQEEVRTYSYVPSKENPADKLTKVTLETPIFSIFF